ncbi:hypothetical protein GYMLUDRAFT_248589 [Collybiopsis luxurians FD-317 M1]|uniref:Cyanovirin-N domain-containing protein n=1 Tax=Collybiopsis luxurians FD-317 M1 TaxID=944289 RepID=A0A0D0BLC6_9AGAR|nr:hypothetical protein GYMLUDRAFT_248589 [Collybiopsis luxurians FD-317 M1]
MPFHSSWQNPHLINSFLTVKYAGKNVTLDLDSCLSVANGKLIWGGRGGFSALQNQSLSGSDFSGELEFQGKSVTVYLDLSTNIQVKGGKLVYVATRTPSPKPVKRDSSRAVSPSADPPPSYQASFFQEFKTYKSTHQQMTYSEQSSLFFKISVGTTLRLTKSILSAECRDANGKPCPSSTLDLNSYIGIVNGKLVWGREGFFSACQSVRLEEFLLHAECEVDAKKVTSTLDLARYLYVYDGMLGVKVHTDTTDLTKFFTEAPWMKVKVVTETNSDGVLGAVGEGAAFKTAFSSLAEASSKHIDAEITQEFYESANVYLKDMMENEVKTQMTEEFSNAVWTNIEDKISAEIEEAFSVAKKTVLTACKKMVNAAIEDVSVKYTESVVGPMQGRIVEACDKHMQSTIVGISASAIARFQERAEILLERELVAASVRRAQTQARLLEMFSATLQQGALQFGF